MFRFGMVWTILNPNKKWPTIGNPNTFGFQASTVLNYFVTLSYPFFGFSL